MRYAYYRLLHGKRFVSDAGLPSWNSGDESVSALLDGPESLWDAIAALQEKGPESPVSETVEPARVLLGYAPTALLDGCWLMGCVQVQHSHTLLGGICLDAFLLESGSGDAARHHGTLYRTWLAAQGLSVPVPASREFAADQRFSEEDFELAVLGLRLGRVGAALLPEALGFHVAMTQWGPPQAVLRAAESVATGEFFAVHAKGSPEQNRAEQLCRRSLRAYAELGEADWPRLYRAALALHKQRRIWLASLAPKESPSARQQMLSLVAGKLQHGAGFHRRVLLAGRTLESWLDPGQPDLSGFLAALAHSPWVVPGQPERSLLIQRSTQFGGPMFGVFSDSEQAVIRRWISSLSEDDQLNPEDRDIARQSEGTYPVAASIEEVEPPAGIASEPIPSCPKLYHRFLCEGDQVSTIELAHRYVSDRLREVESAADVDKLQQQGLWPWSAQRLSDWVNARLHENGFAAADSQSDTPGIERHLSRREVIWMLTQLAPAALIDGAWLQGITSPASYHTAVSALLYQIYRDELGAGIPHQHHGNIMRKVLAEQQVSLPACDSPLFVTHEGFLKESFSTPVLWLAFALVTESFLPELLGLNLAIEMAGVGRMYNRASTLLRQHQIDPYFFVLHNTIDNGASGHTAWSVQATSVPGIARRKDSTAAGLGQWEGIGSAFVRCGG